jgi:polysaccharide biosynthesis transport protein
VDDRDDVISLQDYLTVLRRRRWLIVAVVVLTVLAAVGASLVQTPVYEAEAEVIVEPVRRAQDVSLEELLGGQQNSFVETERLVVTSRPVATRAAEALGTSEVSELLEDVRVEAVRDTRVVRILATDTDPVQAASTADAFATAYLDHRRAQAVDELLAAAATIETRATAIREDIAAIDAQLEDADGDEETALQLERDSLIAQLATVNAQAAEAGDGGASVAGGGSVLSPAEVPVTPVSPQPLRNAALALVLGLMLGVGLAFLRDFMDDVIRDESDFKRATGGRPIVGRIPGWTDPDGSDRLATIVDPMSTASEAYRELSAGVRFMLLATREVDDVLPEDGTPLGRSIMMTSSTAGDGKTSTAANLAVAAARVGLRTLLVDADLRRASVGKRFGLGRTTGLSDVLLSGDSLHDHVVGVGVDNLLILPAGTIPPNPSELLASPAMRALERDIAQQVDLVIYDSPAVLAVPDALELGRHVDLAIIVARADVTGRRQLASAIERLEQVGTEVSGTVLNDIDGSNDAYYYSYYYGGKDGPSGSSASASASSASSRDAAHGKRGRRSRPDGEPTGRAARKARKAGGVGSARPAPLGSDRTPGQQSPSPSGWARESVEAGSASRGVDATDRLPAVRSDVDQPLFGPRES